MNDLRIDLCMLTCKVIVNLIPPRPVIFEDLVSNAVRRNDKFVGSGSGDDFNVDYSDSADFR